jgi:two-component system sensor histidine kinase CpxA
VYFVGSTAAAIVFITLLFWCPFSFRITQALSEVTSATERIADGKFDTRLKVRGKDEFGRLSEAVNQMAERLSNFVTGQRRFLGDIAHELFSPLARLNAALELLDESVPEEHRSLILDIREEVQEMNTLLHELLAYSKAGFREKQPELSAVNLKSVLDSVLSRLGANSTVDVDIASSLNALADPLLLDRSISNIIRNSVRYAGDCGPITVTAASLGTEISVVIADQGPGVAPDTLSRLCEPFFRPESARTRSSGGVGLGLAIVKSCIEACGGSLLLRNRQAGGFEVEVRLKAA